MFVSIFWALIRGYSVETFLKEGCHVKHINLFWQQLAEGAWRWRRRLSERVLPSDTSNVCESQTSASTKNKVWFTPAATTNLRGIFQLKVCLLLKENSSLILEWRWRTQTELQCNNGDWSFVFVTPSHQEGFNEGKKRKITASQTALQCEESVKAALKCSGFLSLDLCHRHILETCKCLSLSVKLRNWQSFRRNGVLPVCSSLETAVSFLSSLSRFL